MARHGPVADGQDPILLNLDADRAALPESLRRVCVGNTITLLPDAEPGPVFGVMGDSFNAPRGPGLTSTSNA